MTKSRAPLTIDAALARIAGQIPGGWATMADLTGRKERTVRNWGDPDTPEQIPLDCAVTLDCAFQEAGGDGMPLHDVYSHLLELALAKATGCQRELARRTRKSILESSEAHDALVAAMLSGAPEDLAVARREVTEAIDALKETLPELTDGAGPAGGARESMSPGGDKA